MDILNTNMFSSFLTEDHFKVEQAARDFFTTNTVNKYIDERSGTIKRSLWSKLGDLGLLGRSVPTEYGGPGLDILAGVLIKKSLSVLEDNGLSLGFHVHNDVGCSWVSNSFNDKAKHQLLPKAVSGESLFCTCYTDADKNHPATITHTSGVYHLNAHKGFSVNGLHSDICLVTAEFNGQTATVFVHKDSEGVEITKHHSRLGNKLIDQVNIAFKNVALDEDSFLTKGSIQRLHLWNKVMTNARFFVALDAYYLLKKLHNRYIDSVERKVVINRPLNTYGLYKDFSRDIKLTIKKVELALHQTLYSLLNNKNSVIDAAKVKRYAVEKLIYFADKCCEAEGGYGYMNDGLFSNIHLQALGLRFSSGSQVVLNEIISNNFNTIARLEDANS